MKKRQQPLLQLGRKVNQQIATNEDIKLGERRIHYEILRGEG